MMTLTQYATALSLANIFTAHLTRTSQCCHSKAIASMEMSKALYFKEQVNSKIRLHVVKH